MFGIEEACAYTLYYSAHASMSQGRSKPVERYIGPDRKSLDASLHRSAMYGTCLLLAFFISGGYLICQMMGVFH